MHKALTDIQRRLALITSLSFALAPLAAYALAITFNLISTDELLQPAVATIMGASYVALTLWVYLHFRRLLAPTVRWIQKHNSADRLPDDHHQKLLQFSGNYWAFFLIGVLVLSAEQIWLGAADNDPQPILHFLLLKLVVAILVGMPGYLLALATLGKLTCFVGLPQVVVSMRTKMLLVGAYIPLLTTTTLLQYYWWRTHFISLELLMVWGLLGLTAFVLTVLAIRGLTQSLNPVYKVISGTGASTYAELARSLSPQSTDEVGYMVHTLGRLFRRLGEQDTMMHAIIDNAAEGIIVVDLLGKIVTFNPAAEKLFGFSKHETKGKSLGWLIPGLVDEEGAPLRIEDELETEGLPRQGKAVPVSVRMSDMHMDGGEYRSILVADISVRKKAQINLIEAEARYRDLVETAHDLVWSMDAEGCWTYLNYAALRIYGHSTTAMLGKPFTDFQAPESAQRDVDAFHQVMEGRELVQYETVHLNADGQPRHISFNARPLKDEHGKIIRITGTARDITEQKVFEHELTYQAQHDSLTGLYNRNYFHNELERLVARLARSANNCALLYLDLDQFKYVNDTQGHASGDRLLIECTKMLKRHVREGDLLARFGGDEFTVLLYNVDERAAMKVAENIRVLFEAFRYMDGGKTFNITCSIGVALLDGEIESADEALSHADLACNISKTQGRNCVHRYNPLDNQKAGMAEDIGWATRVRDAIEKDRFRLVFQPIYHIANDHVKDYEVLLRMRTEAGEIIMPNGFMPAAERFGLINNVDRWTVRRAMEHLAGMRGERHDVHFSINLSGRAFDDKELLPMISSILNDTKLDPSAITFEITETAAIANIQAAVHFIGSLKDLGCQFALDDFGSGFCSFTYLKHLPVDKLKIDGAFVQGLATGSVDQAMVQSMNQVAHALGKKTIAEFVEDAETLVLLREFGVDFAQGNFVGRPESEIVLTPSAKYMLN